MRLPLAKVNFWLEFRELEAPIGLAMANRVRIQTLKGQS